MKYSFISKHESLVIRINMPNFILELKLVGNNFH